MIDGIITTEAISHAVSANILEFQNQIESQAKNPFSSSSAQNSLGSERPNSNLDVHSVIENNADLSIGHQILLGVSAMDVKHKSVIQQINNWPDFDQYLEKHGVPHSMNPDVGITHVSNIGVPESNQPSNSNESLDNATNRYEVLLQEERAHHSASTEYRKDILRWSIGSKMWSSSVEILGAAVSQISTGLKTLLSSQ